MCFLLSISSDFHLFSCFRPVYKMCLSQSHSFHNDCSAVPMQHLISYAFHPALSETQYQKLSTAPVHSLLLTLTFANIINWFTTPTAATALSEYWLSMIVSTAPSIIINKVSIKIGTTSLDKFRRTLLGSFISFTCYPVFLRCKVTEFSDGNCLTYIKK